MRNLEISSRKEISLDVECKRVTLASNSLTHESYILLEDHSIWKDSKRSTIYIYIFMKRE